MTDPIITTLSILTIVGQAIALIGIITLWVARKNVSGNWLMRFTAANGPLLALIVSSIAVAGSLYLSDVRGFEPCLLCWYQRIAMYPQVILLFIGFFKRDSRAIFYSGIMSAIGFLISGYHYLMQWGVIPEGSCSVVGYYSVSCAKRLVMHFGYITIPLMAVTAFLLIFLIWLAHRKVARTLKP
jgi:disulfide bond formation protein DsbB